MTEKVLYSSDDFWDLPDDNMVHEIIDGEHVVNKTPGIYYQIVLRNLIAILTKTKLEGEVIPGPGLIIDDENGHIPDLAIVSKENKQIIKDRGIFGSPDWIIEIISPGGEEKDLVDKKEVYKQNKVKEYWAINIEKEEIAKFTVENNYEIELFKHNEIEEIQSSKFNITIKLKEIFERNI